MFKFAVFACVVLWSSLAEAVKWDFDDGTTQGWAAKTATAWGGSSEFHLFPGEVEDGVWRVDVSPSVARKRDISPNVALISSTIGYDSHLFDRVRVRFRTAHHRPTVGLVRLAWTNEHNLTAPGLDPEKRSKSRFTIHSMDDFAYTTTEWQEVEFTLPAEMRSCGRGFCGIFGWLFSLLRTKRPSPSPWMSWSGTLRSPGSS